VQNVAAVSRRPAIEVDQHLHVLAPNDRRGLARIKPPHGHEVAMLRNAQSVKRYQLQRQKRPAIMAKEIYTGAKEPYCCWHT
jgi:hypothetical protein